MRLGMDLLAQPPYYCWPLALGTDRLAGYQQQGIGNRVSGPPGTDLLLADWHGVQAIESKPLSPSIDSWVPALTPGINSWSCHYLPAIINDNHYKLWLLTIDRLAVTTLGNDLKVRTIMIGSTKSWDPDNLVLKFRKSPTFSKEFYRLFWITWAYFIIPNWHFLMPSSKTDIALGGRGVGPE